MKCLNPACGSPLADEMNVWLNVSRTTGTLAIEYTGDTDFGDCSDLIATYCEVCNTLTYVHDWQKIVTESAAPPKWNMEMIVLPEPRWCHQCLDGGQGVPVHSEYMQRHASKWDTGAYMCDQHALEYAANGGGIIKWENVRDWDDE